MDRVAPTLLATVTNADCGSCVAQCVEWRPPACPGPIQIVSLRGVITLGALGRLAAWAAATEERRGVMAAVLLFNAALIAVTAEEMLAVERPYVRAGSLRYPAALVVADSTAPMFRHYARLMTLGDLVGRRIILASETAALAQALSWAQELGPLPREA